MTINLYSIMDVAPTISQVLGLPALSSAKGRAIADIVEDLVDIHRVAVLALDAFGWYAWQLWHSEMPYLQSLHAKRSIILRSVLPSITPVNFAAMVTGTDLEGHGVRTYNDDFQCETLFDTVRRLGGKSAGIGFDGYTGSMLLARYADVNGVTERGSDDNIARKVIEIAQTHHPEFMIAQLGRVDDIFHLYGPSSPEVKPMLRETDQRLELMAGCLKPLGYGIVILADHGQHDLVNDPSGKRGGHGGDSDADCQVPCTWL